MDYNFFFPLLRFVAAIVFPKVSEVDGIEGVMIRNHGVGSVL